MDMLKKTVMGFSMAASFALAMPVLAADAAAQPSAAMQGMQQAMKQDKERMRANKKTMRALKKKMYKDKIQMRKDMRKGQMKMNRA
jgi:hypothetical protein